MLGCLRLVVLFGLLSTSCGTWMRWLVSLPSTSLWKGLRASSGAFLPEPGYLCRFRCVPRPRHKPGAVERRARCELVRGASPAWGGTQIPGTLMSSTAWRRSMGCTRWRASCANGVGRVLSDGFTVVKGIWPPLRYVSPFVGRQLGRADALLGLHHRVYDEGLGEDGGGRLGGAFLVRSSLD